MYINGKLVGQELKSLRSKKNETIEEVSNSIGIHFNTLSKYEKDATDMSLGLLGKILEHYGVDELIFFKVMREYNHISNLISNY